MRKKIPGRIKGSRNTRHNPGSAVCHLRGFTFIASSPSVHDRWIDSSETLFFCKQVKQFQIVSVGQDTFNRSKYSQTYSLIVCWPVSV